MEGNTVNTDKRLPDASSSESRHEGAVPQIPGNTSTGVMHCTLTDADVFSYVVDIAIAARRAQEKAAETEKRAEYVEELAIRARSEAVSMNEVAASLARTAASIGRVALQICQYRNYQEAFRADCELEQRIDFETFTSIVQPPLYPLKRHSVHEIRPSTNSKESSYVWRADYQRPRAKPLFELPEYDSLSRDGDLFHCTHATPNTQFSRGRSNSGPASCGMVRKSSSSGMFPESSEKFVEKFPTHHSPVEYKGTLATSFDSCTENMPPLWENRYCVPNTGNASKSIPNAKLGQSESWSEKKTMKQFQMKLQKYGIDNENGHKQGQEECQNAGNSCHTPKHAEEELALYHVTSSRPAASYTGESETGTKNSALQHERITSFKGSSPHQDQRPINYKEIVPHQEGRSADYKGTGPFEDARLADHKGSNSRHDGRLTDSEDDGEVNRITSNSSEQQTVRKVRAKELGNESAGQHLSPKKSDRRPVSPLLSDQEKEHYTMAGHEDLNSPGNKQIFVHQRQEDAGCHVFLDDIIPTLDDTIPTQDLTPTLEQSRLPGGNYQ